LAGGIPRDENYEGDLHMIMTYYGPLSYLHMIPQRAVTFSWWGGLRTSMTRRAMLAGVLYSC